MVNNMSSATEKLKLISDTREILLKYIFKSIEEGDIKIPDNEIEEIGHLIFMSLFENTDKIISNLEELKGMTDSLAPVYLGTDIGYVLPIINKVE